MAAGIDPVWTRPSPTGLLRPRLGLAYVSTVDLAIRRDRSHMRSIPSMQPQRWQAAAERACHMFTAEQYRAKAAEFRAFLTNALRSSTETSELRHLEQTYTTLAENEEWMVAHLDKTLQRRKDSDSRTALVEEEEQILKCLGAALIMHWNTVPTKLQRELFDCASGIGDQQQAAPLKGQIARFLHNHKDDEQKSG